jgi:polyhydroxybutyrate depolymerase
MKLLRLKWRKRVCVLWMVAALSFVVTTLQVTQNLAAKGKFLPGKSFQTIMVADQSRQYLLVIPSYDKSAPLPLVFDFHGSGSTPEKEIGYSDFARLAEKKGFILVAPKGLHDNGGKASWNTTMDPGSVDDIALIKKIIQELTRELAIDEKKIYAAGMSGGARMSSRTACELSEIFAAIAPVAGIQFPDDCAPARAMPVITFHGEEDMVNHYVHNNLSRPYWKKGVEDSVAGWVNRNGCNQNQQIEKISEMVTKFAWTDCKDGAEVIFYRIEDGGHTWPGSPIVLTTPWSGNTRKDVIASERIWKFFEDHPLP